MTENKFLKLVTGSSGLIGSEVVSTLNWRIAPVAAAYAATSIAFAMANRLTTSANAIFLQSTAPLYLLLLGPLLLKERIHREGLLYMLAVAADRKSTRLNS